MPRSKRESFDVTIEVWDEYYPIKELKFYENDGVLDPGHPYLKMEE